MSHETEHSRRFLAVSRNYLLGQRLPTKAARRYQLRLQIRLKTAPDWAWEYSLP